MSLGTRLRVFGCGILILFSGACGDASSASGDFPREAMSASSDGNTLRIAFWNIRDLSLSSRDQSERLKICEIIRQSQFDAVGICEVNDEGILGELDKLLDSPGDEWDSITSKKVGRSANSAEHYGVLFRSTKLQEVWHEELPDRKLSDLDIDGNELNLPSDLWFDREPFAVRLTTTDGHLDFVYVLTHVTWGASTKPRIAEVRALSYYYTDAFAEDKDVILCGDFNRNVGDAKSLGWLTSKTGLIDTTSPEKPTVVQGSSTYDHILVHTQFTSEYSGNHGVIAFDEEMFGNDDAAAKMAVSDHRPVWIELQVPNADDD